MRFIWQLLAVGAVAFIGGQGTMAVDGNPWLTLAIGIATVLAVLPVYAWVVRRTEKRDVTELERSDAPGGLLRGLLIGVAMFGAVIINLYWLGYYDVEGSGSATGAIGLFGFMAAAAVTEELLFRGVLFRIVEEKVGTWIALVLSGLVFGLAHLPNENATLWGATAIAIEAGAMLAAAYVATRSLWLPIGLHFGWNYAASGIFSTQVSGNETEQGLLDSTLTGPKYISGGSDFGPEGSLYAVLFGALMTVGFLWLAHRRGNLVPMRRRAGRDTGADAGTTVA